MISFPETLLHVAIFVKLNIFCKWETLSMQNLLNMQFKNYFSQFSGRAFKGLQLVHQSRSKGPRKKSDLGIQQKECLTCFTDLRSDKCRMRLNETMGPYNVFLMEVPFLMFNWKVMQTWQLLGELSVMNNWTDSKPWRLLPSIYLIMNLF